MRHVVGQLRQACQYSAKTIFLLLELYLLERESKQHFLLFLGAHADIVCIKTAAKFRHWYSIRDTKYSSILD